jgi:hypothetical protein
MAHEQKFELPLKVFLNWFVLSIPFIIITITAGYWLQIKYKYLLNNTQNLFMETGVAYIYTLALVITLYKYTKQLAYYVEDRGRRFSTVDKVNIVLKTIWYEFTSVVCIFLTIPFISFITDYYCVSFLTYLVISCLIVLPLDYLSKVLIEFTYKSAS